MITHWSEATFEQLVLHWIASNTLTSIIDISTEREINADALFWNLVVSRHYSRNNHNSVGPSCKTVPSVRQTDDKRRPITMYSMPFGQDLWISVCYLLSKFSLEKNHSVDSIYCAKSVSRNVLCNSLCYCQWPTCGNINDVDFWHFGLSTPTIETTQDNL